MHEMECAPKCYIYENLADIFFFFILYWKVIHLERSTTVNNGLSYDCTPCYLSPVLTWRDMQHLTVLTSKRNSLFDAKNRFYWNMNGKKLNKYTSVRPYLQVRYLEAPDVCKCPIRSNGMHTKKCLTVRKAL